jgi:hypothetical protein
MPVMKGGKRPPRYTTLMTRHSSSELRARRDASCVQHECDMQYGVCSGGVAMKSVRHERLVEARMQARGAIQLAFVHVRSAADVALSGHWLHALYTMPT